MQVFNKDQLHYISKGQVHQKTLKNHINEALFNNPFNANYILASLPGLGKSFETQEALKQITNNPPLVIEGTASMPAFTIDIATAVYLSGGQHLVVVLDDCDVLFENANTNTTKKMFDDARYLRYGKNHTALKQYCTELQWSAIESFTKPERAGFSVPLNNVTFLILTNRHLPTVNEVENMDPTSKKASNSTDLYAIRRRTETKEIEMDANELWGYVANVVLNNKICEKFMPKITVKYKNQILDWCFQNWDKVTERNLSLIEKMTKDIVRYPKDYLDIWNTNYIQVENKKGKK